MKAEKASKKATPRPIPTPSPTLAPPESPCEEFEGVSLFVDCWLDDDDDDDDVVVVVVVVVLNVDRVVVVAVVEAGKSVAWKLIWNMGAYNIIVSVEVSSSTPPLAVSVWVTVMTLGKVSMAELVI